MRSIPASLRNDAELKEHMIDQLGPMYPPSTGITLRECSNEQLSELYLTLPDKRPSTDPLAQFREAGIPVAVQHHQRHSALKQVRDDLTFQEQADLDSTPAVGATSAQRDRVSEIYDNHPSAQAIAEAEPEPDDGHDDGGNGVSMDGDEQPSLRRPRTAQDVLAAQRESVRSLRECGVSLSAKGEALLPKPRDTSIATDDLVAALHESGLLDSGESGVVTLARFDIPMVA
jgi:hypothetical protein